LGRIEQVVLFATKVEKWRVGQEHIAVIAVIAGIGKAKSDH